MKKNIIFIAIILLVALICAVIFNLNSQKGAVARVSIVGVEDIYISLDEDKIYEIEGDLPVRLQVQDGTICFIDSVCPDHLCEGFGKLQNENEQAICLPAGVVVTIED